MVLPIRAAVPSTQDPPHSAGRRTRHVAGIVGLLLISAFVPSMASDPEHSKLGYGAGKVFQTDLFEAHLLAQLAAPGKEPYLVFVGRPDPKQHCVARMCDSETSVYFQSPSDTQSGPMSVSDAYPGDYYVSDTGTLVRRVRMFIGQCLDSREGVVWFTHQTLPHRFTDDVSAMFVDGDELQPEWFTSQRPDLAVALAAVTKNICHEILPARKFYKTAAAYEGENPFRTDCSSPAPSPSIMPLAPGRPARPLAYRDKQADVVLYVESDGRHLAAIDANGKLLWIRDPFTDSDLCPYRSERPIIVYVGPLRDDEAVGAMRKIHGPLIEIRFDSSQYGAVDVSNGDFFFMGQN